MAEHAREPQSELDALLLELARDPRATMLRLASRLPKRTPEELEAQLSPHATGLTITEREILRTHREELGELLSRLSLEVLLRDPIRACVVAKFDGAHKPLKRSGYGELARSGTLLERQSSRLAGDLLTPLALLTTAENAQALDLRSVAQASLRVFPSYKAKLRYVHAQFQYKEYRAASRITTAMLGAAISVEEKSLSWAMHGHLEMARGNLGIGVACYSKALELSQGNGVAAINLLVAGLQAGDGRACRIAARTIEKSMVLHPEEFRQIIADLRSQSRIRGVRYNIHENSLLNSARAEFGELTLKVIDAVR